MKEKILEAPISHQQEPHCCGCWIIWRTDDEVYAECNECGEWRDILAFLSSVRPTTAPTGGRHDLCPAEDLKCQYGDDLNCPALYLIDGKPYRECDCSMNTPTCPQGRERSFATAGFNRCMLPAPDVLLVSAAPSTETATDYKALYMELIYAVARKWPNETRHQTALRYINEAENQPCSGPSEARSATAPSTEK